jgi:hypothetical protein
LRLQAEQINQALAGLAGDLAPVAPSPGARGRLLDRIGSAPPARAPGRDSAARTLAFAPPPPVRARVAGPGASVALVGALAALGALILVALNWPRGPLLVARAPALALLALAQVAGLWAALGPGRSRWAPVAWAATAVGAAVALAGHVGDVSPAPGWICTAIQLLGGLAPLAVVLRSLRGLPWSWQRAAGAGVALGTAGVIWGEIGCQRSALHVLVSHGGTWLCLIAACLLLSRLLRPCR